SATSQPTLEEEINRTQENIGVPCQFPGTSRGQAPPLTRNKKNESICGVALVRGRANVAVREERDQTRVHAPSTAPPCGQCAPAMRRPLHWSLDGTITSAARWA